MPLRLRGFSLAEVLLALGILSIAILAVAPLGVRVVQSLHQGETSDVSLFHAASHVLESARIHVQANENGFATLESTFNGREFVFDSHGLPRQAPSGDIVGRLQVVRDASFSKAGDRLLRLVSRASYTANDQSFVELATLLAAPPPREHLIFSGFLRQEGADAVHWDDYWGGYYGATFGRRQGKAYREGNVEVEAFPLPAEPDRRIDPPPAATPLPWGWD